MLQRREILAGLQGDNKEALCSEVYEAESLTDGINMAAELMKKAGEDEGKPPAMVIFGSLSYLGDIYGIIKNTAWEKSL